MSRAKYDHETLTIAERIAQIDRLLKRGSDYIVDLQKLGRSGEVLPIASARMLLEWEKQDLTELLRGEDKPDV